MYPHRDKKKVRNSTYEYFQTIKEQIPTEICNDICHNFSFFQTKNAIFTTFFGEKKHFALNCGRKFLMFLKLFRTFSS